MLPFCQVEVLATCILPYISYSLDNSGQAHQVLLLHSCVGICKAVALGHWHNSLENELWNKPCPFRMLLKWWQGGENIPTKRAWERFWRSLHVMCTSLHKFTFWSFIWLPNLHFSVFSHIWRLWNSVRHEKAKETSVKQSLRSPLLYSTGLGTIPSSRYSSTSINPIITSGSAPKSQSRPQPNQSGLHTSMSQPHQSQYPGQAYSGNPPSQQGQYGQGHPSQLQAGVQGHPGRGGSGLEALAQQFPQSGNIGRPRQHMPQGPPRYASQSGYNAPVSALLSKLTLGGSFHLVSVRIYEVFSSHTEACKFEHEMTGLLRLAMLIHCLMTGVFTYDLCTGILSLECHQPHVSRGSPIPSQFWSAHLSVPISSFCPRTQLHDTRHIHNWNVCSGHLMPNLGTQAKLLRTSMVCLGMPRIRNACMPPIWIETKVIRTISRMLSERLLRVQQGGGPEMLGELLPSQFLLEGVSQVLCLILPMKQIVRVWPRIPLFHWFPICISHDPQPCRDIHIAIREMYHVRPSGMLARHQTCKSYESLSF